MAVIGQALNLSFDVTLDPGVDAGSACAGAELYYGETRIDASRFRVGTQAGAGPSQVVVQVASQVAVNEPVVSVVLRAGCGQSLSRRYVLLSASPSEGPLSSANDLPAAPAFQAAVPVPDAGSGAAGVAAGRARPQRPARLPPVDGSAVAAAPATPPVRRPAAAESTPVPRPGAATGASPRSARPPVGGLPAGSVRGRPRLELQSAADWLNERDIPLQPSLSMATPGTASPEQRAAAAAMWRALNGEADSSTPAAPVAAAATGADDERLRKLEAQLKALQDGAARGRVREAELQAQLEAAHNEGGAMRAFLWPAVLVALLGLLGLAAAIYRRRAGERAAWWKPARPMTDAGAGGTAAAGERPEFVDTHPSVGDETAPPDDDFQPTIYPPEFPVRPTRPDMRVPAAVPQAQPVAQVRPPVPTPPPPAPMPSVEPELPGASLTAAEVSGFEVPMGQAAPAEPAEAEPAVVPPALLNTRESILAAAQEMRESAPEVLLDVQQNAEFFASVGQYEEAIETLQQHIAAQPLTSPVAYLDLMRILHTLSLTDPYRKLRDEFNTIFNAEMPAFAGYLKPSRSLDAFPEALHRIQAAWRKPQVLDVLETFLFRRLANDEGTSPFALEAYRELLMLYEVARANQAQGGMEDIPPHVVPAAVVAPAVAAMAVPVPAPQSTPDEPQATAPDNPPSLAELVAARPVAKPELDQPLDFVLDDLPVAPAPAVPAARGGSGLQPDIDLSLDFEDPSAPMLEFDLSSPAPPPETPAAKGFGAAPAADDHLIDFDLFDDDLPPGGKKLKP